jgi:GT2 family glycosyltransferase/tetratricopeptide (TPR) repeat protein
VISIIIPVCGQLAYTRNCIEAIEAFTPEPHEVIIVDNGSTDGTPEWVRDHATKHPGYTLIRNDTNLGFPAACNQGAAFSRGEYILFLNNDTVVSKEWLTGLMEAIKSAPDIACVGPMTNYVSGPQQVNDVNGYDTLKKYQEYAINCRKAYRGLYVPFWRIVGFCLLVSREIFDKLSGFDERFSPGNFEDDDFCLRACLAGYRNLMCRDVFIHHHGSETCKKMDFGNLLAVNKAKFDEKWSGVGKKISAVMIVKDEEFNIGSCISHIYRDVDEIIVVDTGSTDATKAIAAGAGPKVHVYDFKWCDDFSAARNFADSKATGDWLLSVDADEEITGLDKLTLKPFHAYRITTRNYSNNPKWANATECNGEYPEQEQGLRWFPSTKIRLYPHDKRITWEYPVHEVVENSVYYLGMQLVEPKEVIVHHYGRMNDDYEYGHGDKYYELLHKQFQSGKNDLRSLEQLALAAQGLEKWDDAIRFWEDLLKLDPADKTAPFNMGHCYAETGRWDEALEWSRKALVAEPDNKDAAMNVATCECMAGDRAIAEKICEDLIAKYPTYPLPQGLLNALKISQQGGTQDGNNKS